MALIVEDGTVVTGANTYVSVADFRSYCAERGLDVTTWTDEVIEQRVFVVMDYLNGLNYQGTRTQTTQPLPFPRYNVYLDRIYQDSDIIPDLLKKAECQAIYDSYSNELQPTVNSVAVVREKLDDMEIEYAASGQVLGFKVFTKLNAFISPLLSKTIYGRIHL